MPMPIIDSAMKLDEALAGKEIPGEILGTLTLIDVLYISFDKCLHRGQLIVHKHVSTEVQNIFKKLLEIKFPIAKMIPVTKFDWDDDRSMAANNTSAFNYRLIYGTNQISNHSFGLAIDINPVQNPYVRADGSISPPRAHYEPSNPGTVTTEVAEIFISCGWEWGGNWKQKDWQHFQKTLR
jgi:hypothetical protein